ncbi:hypothetical protein JN11_01200 [Mucilaginibacter frigoritolerans]|uniref:Uncharacterized protein n=1 Tax=Mucilaginibacter frigoritolerans TaxID=652788 RepID=A0A562U920_9SPHI|nr:hypothetical protein [Mucilaginibacter frigoritolerans]TWJ02228.1 hypothetical protein JN11_01200 [Mucilaginibacter frigoritolerans]
MLSENEILATLDNSNHSGDYSHFIQLGHPYSYLIDCRLNIFRNDDQWAIVAERLGYSERCGAIELEIDYFGNCLQNLEQYNGQYTNNYTLYPVDQDSFDKTTDGFSLYTDAGYWIVGGKKVSISTNIQDYIDNKIELCEYEAGEITLVEAARLSIINYAHLFRATEDALYKSLPKSLKKVLVLDEWFHKDFIEIPISPFESDEQIKQVFDFNKQLTGLEGIDFETFKSITKNQDVNKSKLNEQEWINNRPSSYETWQQLARVIATGDQSFYKPSLLPNTHWKNWPESGSL